MIYKIIQVFVKNNGCTFDRKNKALGSTEYATSMNNSRIPAFTSSLYWINNLLLRAEESGGRHGESAEEVIRLH